jgi:hypothetical protein
VEVGVERCGYSGSDFELVFQELDGVSGDSVPICGEVRERERLEDGRMY